MNLNVAISRNRFCPRSTMYRSTAEHVNMLMLTKRLAIVVAAVLGAASGVTWVVPTSAQTAHSKIEKKISDVTHLKTGDFVRPRTGGPLMSVDSIENGH